VGVADQFEQGETALFGTLKRLHAAGVRYGSAIDIGCADGSFLLEIQAAGILDGASTLNIDASRVYETSLQEIQRQVGTHYWIGAVSDRAGEVEVTVGAHPYWTSMRPSEDLYWKRINGLRGETTTVPARTLDTLTRDFGLVAPYLIKLDVQGAEASVLRGARNILADTHVVVCEADMADFQDLNSLLVEAGFVLHDITHVHRDAHGDLGWFYPVFAKARLDAVKPKSFWGEDDNSRVLELQEQRRRTILKRNAELLRRLTNTHIGRNVPCPCGSGRKYKHCCGEHGPAGRV
jgi:FkbM family methyltransferase